MWGLSGSRRFTRSCGQACEGMEFVTTSITSQAWPQERVNRLLPDNPHILLADGRYRGYTRVRLTPERWSADLRIVETVQRPDAPFSTLATYVVENGRPGPLKA